MVGGTVIALAVGLAAAVPATAPTRVSSCPVATSNMRPMSASSRIDVRALGDLRLIGRNRLNNAVPLSSLADSRGLYGLGMSSGLDTELAIFDGVVHTGQFRSERFMARTARDLPVGFLVHANVDHWREIPVPATISSFDGIVAYLRKMGIEHGLAGNPFMFRIVGHAEHLKWFVVNGMGNLRPDPQASFLRSRYLGGLENRQIEIVGLFGPACQGVLSSPGNDAHMHFRTIDDGSLFVGHLDNEIELKAGAVLYLPVPPNT